LLNSPEAAMNAPHRWILLQLWALTLPIAWTAGPFITLEDKLLCRELCGYNDYAGRVRARLILGVW
jgi:protein-S-isoprenylcysteine O-methyltransferase Ste14